MTYRTWSISAIAMACAAVSACDAGPDTDAAQAEQPAPSAAMGAPPAPGEGAVGFVGVGNAGAAQNPQTPPLAGGPAGQTPAYGSAGGVPSTVYSDKASPAAVSGTHGEGAGGGIPR